MWLALPHTSCPKTLSGSSYLSLRRVLLKQTLQRAQFLRDCEEEEVWLEEHGRQGDIEALGRDPLRIASAIRKHKVPACSPRAPPSLPPARHAALRPQSLPFSIPSIRPWKPLSATTKPYAQI